MFTSENKTRLIVTLTLSPTNFHIFGRHTLQEIYNVVTTCLLFLECSALRQVQLMMTPFGQVLSSSLQLLVADLLVLLLHE